MKRLIAAGLFCIAATSAAGPASARPTTPGWSGRGAYRVLLTVDPQPLERRDSDEAVAQAPIDFATMLKESDVQGVVDLSTLQVQQFDPGSGEAIGFKPFDSSQSKFDRPCRFEDDSVPDDFPDRVLRASVAESGRGPATVRKRGGRLFNRETSPDRGRIAFVHTQNRNEPSHYAIYFDVKATSKDCGPSPAPWIGDADLYRLKAGQPLVGLAHGNVCAGDFDGDGLFDLLAGAEKGNLVWYPNHGTPGNPKFVGCRILADDDGPIDLGWYASPFLFDWDNDGLIDVVVGTAYETIVWWKNVGARTAPKLQFQGHVKVQGKPLAVPAGPVPEDKTHVFKHDYYNQPWIGDFDGDGTPDILTGGYVTGQIFYFHGEGRGADGTPNLQFAGPLQADGKVLDTVWAAAPFAFDFDGDGRKDLVSGSWFWSGIHRPMQPGEVEYIMYFHNDGAAGSTQLSRRPLPHTGEFPRSSIARPSVIDWNDDGLPDLLVSDVGGSVRVFLNRGQPNQPTWEVNDDGLTAPWGFVRDGGYTSYMPLHKGEPAEFFDGDHFSAYDGSRYSPKHVSRGRASVDGKRIEYPGPGYGDHYYKTCLCDWDNDGNADILYGTQQGNLYVHRGAGGKDRYAFAPGERLKLRTGENFRVGPEIVDSVDKVKDFTVLQGSRIVMTTADFDGDGILDIAVTETYGNIWIFRNSKAGGVDTLEPGVLVGKVAGGGRTNDLSVTDFNDDGKPDLLIGTPVTKPGTVYLNQSEPGKPKFAEPTQPLNLPFMWWGPIIKPLDWNGDGDEDFLVYAEFFAFYVEKSFAINGYAHGRIDGTLQVRK